MINNSYKFCVMLILSVGVLSNSQSIFLSICRNYYHFFYFSSPIRESRRWHYWNGCIRYAGNRPWNGTTFHGPRAITFNKYCFHDMTSIKWYMTEKKVNRCCLNVHTIYYKLCETCVQHGIYLNTTCEDDKRSISRKWKQLML